MDKLAVVSLVTVLVLGGLSGGVILSLSDQPQKKANLNDALNKTNPLDTEPSDVETTTSKFFIPEIMKRKYFKETNVPKFLNREHYHFLHCPYSAEYILNTWPPTFHLRCKHKSSQLGWAGRCVQTFGTVTLEDGENSTVQYNKNCRFIYL